MQKKKGISLIVLVITIIIMLILAGAIVLTLSNSGIIDNAEKSKLYTEIADLKEEIEINALLNNKGEKPRFGTLEQIVGRTDRYNEMLCMENGSLVYDPTKVSEKQASWLEELGIYPRQNIIPIYTAEQFSKIGSAEQIEIDGITYTFNQDSIYYLQNDIDFQGSEDTPNTSIATFSGTLDGQNYTLSNVYMTGEGNQSIFITNKGIIKNMLIKDTYYQSTNNKNIATLAITNNGQIKNIILENLMAGLIATNNSTIEDCRVKNVNNSKLAYGAPSIVYSNNGTVMGIYSEKFNAKCPIVQNNNGSGIIKECYSETNLIDTRSCGGGICERNKGIIENCCFAGNVDGYINAGGIVWWNESNGKIIKCENKGTVTVSNYASGGIATTNDGVIVGCYNSGVVKGGKGNGAICVYNNGSMISCYNVGQLINVWGAVCGLVHENNGTTLGCYNTQENANITSSTEGTVTSSYYYDATNDVMLDQDGVQITDTLLKLLQDANDSLKDDVDYATKKVEWVLDETTGYPVIKK